jgi:hypothetical protein
MNEVCNDNRFEIIEKAKKHLLEATNIEMSPDEMKVLDNFLFRCWQMGWLNGYTPMENGCYMEFFAVKDNKRYNAKTVSLKDMSRALTNGLMDSIEKIVFDNNERN